LTDENREGVLEKTKNEVFEMLKQTIRPEFLNRIDELIMFTPLQESEIRDIVELQIKQVKALLERNGVELEVTEAAIDLFAKEGYDPQFGARPVKRVLQRMLLNELSKQIIAGVINTDKSIRVDVVRDEIEFSN
jgi:ATP-dependent Clp protease ATP-binding subunit ClpB